MPLAGGGISISRRPKSTTIDREEIIGSSDADDSAVEDSPPSSGKKASTISISDDSFVEETPPSSREKPTHRRILKKEATVIPASDSSDCEDSYKSACGDVSTNLSESFATKAEKYSSADDGVPLHLLVEKKSINAKRSSRMRYISSDDEAADEEDLKQPQQAGARFATFSRLNEDLEQDSNSENDQKEKTNFGSQMSKPCRRTESSEDENDGVKLKPCRKLESSEDESDETDETDETDKNLSSIASEPLFHGYNNSIAEDDKRSFESDRSTSSEEHNQNVGKEFIEEECISDDDSIKEFASAEVSRVSIDNESFELKAPAREKSEADLSDVIILSSDDETPNLTNKKTKSSKENYTELKLSKEKIEAKIRQSEAMLGTMNNAGGRNELMRTISKDKIDLDKIKTALGKVEKEVKVQEGTVDLELSRGMFRKSSESNLPQIKNESIEQQVSNAEKRKLELTKALVFRKNDEKLLAKLNEVQRELNSLEKASKPQTVENYHNRGWAEQRNNLGKIGREEMFKMIAPEPAQDKLYGGRMNENRRFEAKAVTAEALQTMHKSLETMPAEADEVEQPKCLRKKITLFPHQRQGLAWLLWRETQHPPGGILADDMGLGKTLTMISLILKHLEIQDDDSDDEWNGKHEGLLKSSATLIVAPASLIDHWEAEIQRKVKSHTLETLVYHGNNRKISARKLSRYDVVITTYGTVQSEIKPYMKAEAEQKPIPKDEESVLLKVAWDRLILDEAHQIRNHKTATAETVCRLRAVRRWCITGTPIQNKEMDLFSLIKFMRVSPFDEYAVWKNWIENKTERGSERMNHLVRSLLLRRTKDQTSNVTGEKLVNLPEKEIIEHKFELNTDEKEVYEKVFKFAEGALQNYMDQAKARRDEEIFGRKAAAATGDDVKVHQLLVLLLRLRQICGHPGLIKTMLNKEENKEEGIEEAGEDVELLAAMNKLTMNRETEKDEEIPKELLHVNNPIFNPMKESSKIVTIIEELTKLEDAGRGEKAVIISQWTSMLEIVKNHLDKRGILSCEINGKVVIRERGPIVDDFNGNPRGPKVMLLSLGAGGVGLNLVGANHLFLLDMHWNPQLENQACDRIYRVGQKREVKIHRFVVQGTVEERILQLQEKKLKLANDVLTGAKRSGPNKLSVEDLQTLFS